MVGAVEWIRTTTVLLPPAPQAGASASSATTAFRFSEVIIDGPKNSAQLLAEVVIDNPLSFAVIFASE